MPLCPHCNQNDCQAITPGLEHKSDGRVLVVLDEIASGMDSNGSFFSGPEGNLLKGLLDGVGLGHADVDVCAVMSCYGSEPRSRRAFSELLARREYQPIISLGDGALSLLCGRAALKDVRGTDLPLHKEFGLDNVRVYPTYNLGLIRRVPTYRKVVLADVRNAVGNSKPPETVVWKYWIAAKG